MGIFCLNPCYQIQSLPLPLVVQLVVELEFVVVGDEAGGAKSAASALEVMIESLLEFAVVALGAMVEAWVAAVASEVEVLAWVAAVASEVEAPWPASLASVDGAGQKIPVGAKQKRDSLYPIMALALAWLQVAVAAGIVTRMVRLADDGLLMVVASTRASASGAQREETDDLRPLATVAG